MNLRSPLLKAGLRFGVSAGLLLWLNYRFGMDIIEQLLPLLRHELSWLDDNYRIISITLTRQAADYFILLDLTPARNIVVNEHLIIRPDAHSHGVVALLAQSVLEPVIIGLVLLSVWPATRPVHYAIRYLIGLPLLLLILPFDAPFVLLGELWQLLSASPQQHDFSLLVIWNTFLVQGGRQMLALFIATMAIVLTQTIHPRINAFLSACGWPGTASPQTADTPE